MHVMSTLTVTAKGQVTLRKDLPKHLGEKITVDKLPDGRPDGRIEMAFSKFEIAA